VTGRNRSEFFIVYGLLFIIIIGFLYVGYQIKQGNTAREELLDLVEEELDERKAKVVAWVQEFTDEDATYLFRERDSRLYVVKAGKDLYKVMYDVKAEEIKYVLNKEEIVYER
jgi:hypothetical protein